MLPNHDVIDVNTWSRRKHFEFFSAFDEPYFGITQRVDCTSLYKRCKSEQISFYFQYLYLILKSVNDVPSMRLRIHEDQPIRFAKIHASSTIARPDETFGFGLFEFHESFEQFIESTRQETNTVRADHELFSAQLGSTPRLDVIHFSALPWLNFSAISHARAFSRKDSVPKVSVGKVVEECGRYSFSVALHLHHALADGRDAAAFFSRLEHYLNAPSG